MRLLWLNSRYNGHTALSASSADDIEPWFCEEPHTLLTDLAGLIIVQLDISSGAEPFGQRHAEPADEVVIASPGQAQRLVTYPCRPVAPR